MIQNVEYSFLGYLFNVFRLFGFTSAYDFLGSLKDVVEVKFVNIKAQPYLIIVTGTMGGARIKIFCQV